MTNDIIKFLGFEDSDIEIVNSQYRPKQRIVTLRKNSWHTTVLYVNTLCIQKVFTLGQSTILLCKMADRS